jgi:FkbM family methyltransferase
MTRKKPILISLTKITGGLMGNTLDKLYMKLITSISVIILIFLRKTNKNYKNLRFGDFDISKFKLLLPKEPLILEVGANDGTTTAEFLKVFPEAKIICFEPDSRSVTEFIKNKFPSNVEINNIALSDKDGTTPFFESSGRETQWTYSSSIMRPVMHKYIHPNIKFEEGTLVKTKKLQTFVSERKISHIDLLWLDTQGYEKSILIGIEEEIMKNIDFIYLEFSIFKLYEGSVSLSQISKLLKYHYILALHQNDVLFAKL